MATRADIAAQLSQVLGGTAAKESFFSAKVISIQGNTCTVDVNGLQLSDVRLQPTTTGGDATLLIVPAVNSFVLVACNAGNLSNMWVVRCEKAEYLHLVASGVNLASLITHFFNTLKNAVITTPNGAGAFDPATKQQLTSIETDFKQLFR